ncbi:MAG: hypothetical protein KAT25_10495 [Sulfuriflexus sp.]|nr:hypothetical protein [Sulfuriflexus sp.]
MKKIALIAAAACMAISGAALADGHAKKGPSKKDVSAAILAAVKSVEAAKSVRGEWRDSYKYLGKAKKAYRKGDMKKAMKLAKKVERQGKMGKAQAHAEMHAGDANYTK